VAGWLQVRGRHGAITVMIDLLQAGADVIFGKMEA
jgi:hypothetical protein